MPQEGKVEGSESGNDKSTKKPEIPSAQTLRPPLSSKYTHQSEISIERKPSIEVLEQVKQTDDHESLVRTAFSLSSAEKIVGEFPCYLVRIVTLPGWMYLTDERICFFAPLPGEEDAPRKSGYLTMKNPKTSLLNSRHYFILQHNVLSWYESAQSHYQPLGSIELKSVTKVQETASRIKKYGFILHAPTGRHTFWADSEVSRKEWMDDLQRSMFMVKNDGDSVRITLPFAKATHIEKAAAFDLVEYIKVSLSDVDPSQYETHSSEDDDVYYFVFFPDIDKAFKTIHDYWKLQDAPNLITAENTTGDDGDDDDQLDAAKPLNDVPDLATMYHDTTINMKLAAPLYIMRALARATYSTLHPEHDESTTLDSDVQDGPPIINKTIKQVSSSTRNLSKAVYHALLPSLVAADQQRDGNNTPSGKEPLTTNNDGSNTISNSIEPNTTKGSKRNQSDSLKAIKDLTTRPLHQLASKDYLPDLKWPSSLTLHDKPSTTSLTTESSSHPEQQKRSTRITESARKRLLISMSTPHLSQLTSSLTPSRYKKEDWTSAPMWLCPDLRRQQQLQLNLDLDLPQTMDEQYQAEANDQRQKFFPMLGTGETVIAVYRATLWRMLPYHGRLYFTQNFVCFHASILAGRQMIVIPYEEIVGIRSLKKPGYYLLYNLGVTTKDMNEEILFDFSSLRLRNSCLALLFLKSQKPILDESNSDGDKDDMDLPAEHLEEKMSTDHVAPPSEYNGPPLLSNVMEAQQPQRAPSVITCLTIGSRGDVQPYIALCKELQKKGAHHCRIATHEEYRHWIEHHGIEFKSIGGNPEDLMKLCIENSFLSISFIKNGSKFFYTWFDTLLETSWKACQGTDVLIESPSAMVGIHIAEKLEIPYFRSMPFPWTKTTKFPHPFASSTISGGPIYNDMTYALIDMAMWLGTSRPINRFRREKLGLPPTSLERLELFRVPCLYSFSAHVQPVPKDWPDYIHCTGYWFLDEHKSNNRWQPPSELRSFLQLDDDDGDRMKKDKRPVVYIGFGSIIVSDPDAMSRVVVEAVMEAGVRAIVCKGWSSRNQEQEHSLEVLQQHPDSILSLESVPHDWLFPLIQGAVHHGGAGTCAAGLRAGLPTVIKPFFGDQRFWATRIETLGVGICMSKLTKLKLKDHLLTITQDEAMINKAKLLGEAIRQENGTKVAVECLYRDMELARRTQRPPDTAPLENTTDNSNRTSLNAYVGKLKRLAPFGTDNFSLAGFPDSMV